MNITRHFTQILEGRLIENLPFMQVVMGPRQVGKTYGIEQILSKWMGAKLFVTADTTIPPQAQWIEAQWLKARSMGAGTLLIIDEIQKITDWSETVKVLFDAERNSKDRIRVVLLGSASLSIDKGLTESLAGRFELIPVAHWDFAESAKLLNNNFETYLRFGGYPASYHLISNPLRFDAFVRDSILETVVSKDILQLARVNKPALLRQCLECALSNPARVLAYQKILGQLHERGNIETVKYYLELLQKAYLIKLLPKYGSALRQRGSSPKIIPLAPALSSLFFAPGASKIEGEIRGSILEAAVGAKLAQIPGVELTYWQDSYSEVDFVLKVGSELWAVEVKSGRLRRSGGLGRILKEYPNIKALTLDIEKAKALLTQSEPDKIFGILTNL